MSSSEALAGRIVILPSLHIQATQSTTEKQLAKTGTNLAASIAAVATLERDMKAAGDKFAFLQDTRAYIADLCDMLQVAWNSSALQPFPASVTCFGWTGEVL